MGYISKPISARFISIAWTPASTTSPSLQASTSLLPASPSGPMPSRLEPAPLPSARANEETAGCWLTSPLERHIENCRWSSTTGCADPFTVPTQEGQSHLSWHHYGPRKSLSSCPLKRHISIRRCTTNSTLIVPTQEAYQHSPLHY